MEESSNLGASAPATAEHAVAPESSPGRRVRLIALIGSDGQEPPADQSDQAALATWAAVSALWHPALLARVDCLPRIESIDSPSPPDAGDLRVLAGGFADRLPSGYRTQAEDAGAILLEGQADRLGLVREILERLEPGAALGPPESQPVALDFLALGTARWWLRDLTVGMGHLDALDVESLTRELLAGARAWRAGDSPGATNRLRAGFELLTQARERFYPVDAYIVDICLVNPSTLAADLADPLDARAPVSLLAPARAIEALAAQAPELVGRIREAVTEGWVDVIGGSYDEVDEPLRPFESILWQFRHGGQVYRQHLDERNVETLARRRFALYPLLPQLGKRVGYRFALHLAFDAGRFPLRSESKRLWESPDGTSLEALLRAPLAADRAAQGGVLPWRLARAMKDDHVATLPLVHWPRPVAPWFLDLRRVAAYSPVLARWVTINDYFHLTDRPYESFQPAIDEYVMPYLAQEVAQGSTMPIAQRAAHVRLRARLDGLAWLHAVSAALAPEEAASGPLEAAQPAIEPQLETGGLEQARTALDRLEPSAAARLAQRVAGSPTGSRAGYLVFNPLCVPRRAAVLLPEAAADLRPEGPLRAAQFTEQGVWAVIDLPAFGYAWVPRETAINAPPAPLGALSARGRTLRNEAIEVEVDATTGGLRSIHAAGEPTARLGQHLVIAGLTAADGKPAASQMRADSFEVEYGGPALVQAISRGTLLDPRGQAALARFEQRYRLWSGRPALDLSITLCDLDPAWLERAARSDPWSHFLACRWAWPDSESMLRRTSLLGPELTEVDRPETPDVLDISTRRQRTALLFGGLAHHRRHGPRMLDTLLVAGRETRRAFELGVVLDLEHPFHAALDQTGPVYVVPVETGPPRAGPAGWFFLVDHRAVAVTRVAYLDRSGDGRGWGLAFHLLETAGRPARCRLRLFRTPLWARQTDYHDELLVDLPIDGDAVQVDLTPREMARVDVTLG